jgi:hypothetical protein
LDRIWRDRHGHRHVEHVFSSKTRKSEE